jgi:hypothetical protein
MATAKKPSKAAAYAAYEKTEPKSVKAKEKKTGESKGEKARETKVGMSMMMKKKGKK